MDRVMKITQRQCLLALLSSVIVVICVFIGITMNLTTLYDENFDHMGIRTFCMFTVNSNILAAVSVAMIIPYTIDGLRKHNYHIPRWVTILTYAGVTVTHQSIQAKLLGDQLGLHPLATLGAIWLGWRVWGVAGMIAFPLLAVCARQALAGVRLRLPWMEDADNC